MAIDTDFGACIYNDGVDCETHNCERCGWNPAVEKERKEAIFGIQKRYKIPFTGYCEVWARNPEEAAEMAEDIQKQFYAYYDYGDPECVEKEEKNAMD